VGGELNIAAPERCPQHDLRAASIAWSRELIRVRTGRLRAITTLAGAIIFLFAPGTGLSSPAGCSTPPGASFVTFIFPGERAMPTLLTLLFPGHVNRAGQGVPIPSARSSSYQSAEP
jgi:hypothetical protein